MNLYCVKLWNKECALTFDQLYNLYVVWVRHQGPINLEVKDNGRDILPSLLHHMWTWGSRLSRKASSKPFNAGKLADFETPSDQSHRTGTHLNDPVPRLNTSSHRGSIYDTKDNVTSSTTRLVYSSIFLIWLVLAEPQIVPLMLPSTAGWWKNMWVSTDLPSLTSCTNTGLSPLTVSPKPFSSLWIITQRWTRPGQQQRRRYNLVALLSFSSVLCLADI